MGISSSVLGLALFLISHEIGPPSRYDPKPICPGCPAAFSGPTIGVGYDLGQQFEHHIRADWSSHPYVDALALAAGVRRHDAVFLTKDLREFVTTDYDYAVETFVNTSLVTYTNRARRCFGPDFERQNEFVRGALVSLVYNRGCPKAQIDRGREYRTIIQTCLPSTDAQCTADQIRAMSRIWVGSPIQRGMTNRRNAEADYALQTH